MDTIERRLAVILLELEPEKKEGGSPERQAWMGIVMDAVVLLHVLGMDPESFRRALLES